ncbi:MULTISPECIES: LpxL/LpxP family acyltransferase [unclassified Paraburkholderia]|uniref:Predicted acyltransferase, LPLAT superfamily n=1 Tax=Paraburkholderia phenazinium TaxID=60549 RepID=A0A1N6GPR6_9BURK|nr:Predicted acyltransferase, LPLAT superfamily [Paraburkholderia phenazinium]
MKRPAWTQRKERSNIPLMRLMTWLSLRLGRRVSRIVLSPASAYFMLFSPAACKASRAYLTRALGRPATWLDVWRHLIVFGATIHDRIYLLNDRFDLFDLRVHGREVMRDTLAEGHGAFLMGAHLGSFEVMRALGRTQPNLRVAITMYEDNARRTNKILASINPAAKQAVIGLGQVDSMLKVREHLDTGSMIGILADRTILGDARDSMRWVDFLGAPAAFPLGPLHMAAMLKRPVIFMTGLYRGGNRYDIHFETLADFSRVERGKRGAEVQAALTRYAALLEKHCRAAPYNWFNFFDFWHAEPIPDGAAASGPQTVAATRVEVETAPEVAATVQTQPRGEATAEPVARQASRRLATPLVSSADLTAINTTITTTSRNT